MLKYSRFNKRRVTIFVALYITPFPHSRAGQNPSFHLLPLSLAFSDHHCPEAKTQGLGNQIQSRRLC